MVGGFAARCQNGLADQIASPPSIRSRLGRKNQGVAGARGAAAVGHTVSHLGQITLPAAILERVDRSSVPTRQVRSLRLAPGCRRSADSARHPTSRPSSIRVCRRAVRAAVQPRDQRGFALSGRIARTRLGTQRGDTPVVHQGSSCLSIPSNFGSRFLGVRVPA